MFIGLMYKLRTGKISGKTQHRAVRAWVVHPPFAVWRGAGLVLGWSLPPPPHSGLRLLGPGGTLPQAITSLHQKFIPRVSIMTCITQNQVHSALHLISVSFLFSQCFFPKLAIPPKTLLREGHSQGRTWGDGGGEAVVFLLPLASSLDMSILPPVMNEEVPSLFCH